MFVMVFANIVKSIFLLKNTVNFGEPTKNRNRKNSDKYAYKLNKLSFFLYRRKLKCLARFYYEKLTQLLPLLHTEVTTKDRQEILFLYMVNFTMAFSSSTDIHLPFYGLSIT